MPYWPDQYDQRRYVINQSISRDYFLFDRHLKLGLCFLFEKRKKSGLHIYSTNSNAQVTVIAKKIQFVHDISVCNRLYCLATCGPKGRESSRKFSVQDHVPVPVQQTPQQPCGLMPS